MSFKRALVVDDSHSARVSLKKLLEQHGLKVDQAVSGEGHELGWFAVFMCSPYAPYLTGQTITLDGGRGLRWYGLSMPEFEPVRAGFGRRQHEAERV
jgi:NAD(P)-dependent dehydrogenase (short-subunit alcohol dehydrogenase family)